MKNEQGAPETTIGDEGVRLLLADSTNAEAAGHAPSETSIGSTLRTLFAENRGRRIITASFASHLHRIQQIADAAVESGRVVATLGLSIRKNVQMGIDLGILSMEGSAFHGREPDEHHYDLEFGSLDSWSTRVWLRPTPGWLIQASYGYLEEPEELEPGDQRRFRLIAIRKAGIVGDINKLRVIARAKNFAIDGQAADAGIENQDNRRSVM